MSRTFVTAALALALIIGILIGRTFLSSSTPTSASPSVATDDAARSASRAMTFTRAQGPSK